jgi:hypothetical protein
MLFTRRLSKSIPRSLQSLAAEVERAQFEWAHQQNARGRAVVLKKPSVRALQGINTKAELLATAIAHVRPIA